MSFKSRDLMFSILPTDGNFPVNPGLLMCAPLTKDNAPEPAPCADATQPPPEPPPAIVERELNLAMLRDQLREALSLE